MNREALLAYLRKKGGLYNLSAIEAQAQMPKGTLQKALNYQRQLPHKYVERIVSIVFKDEAEMEVVPTTQESFRDKDGNTVITIKKKILQPCIFSIPTHCGSIAGVSLGYYINTFVGANNDGFRYVLDKPVLEKGRILKDIPRGSNIVITEL